MSRVYFTSNKARYYGRNKWANQTGITLDKREEQGIISIRPLNCRKQEGAARMEIPLQDLDRIIFELVNIRNERKEKAQQQG